MSETDLEALRRRLEQKQHELDLVLAMDRVRDTVTEPSAMLSAIVHGVARQFGVDLCLLCLLDRESGELELKTVDELRHGAHHLDSATLRALAERAMRAEGMTVWQGPDLVSALGLSQEEAGTQAVSVPICLGPGPLGVILLVRQQHAFSADDLTLLGIAESQLDSAVVQAYARFDLQQRTKELETVYRIDQIRDRHLGFDEMLNEVLHELNAAIEAEMGFIMLFDPIGRRLEMRAVTHDDLFQVSPYYMVVERVAYESLERAGAVCHNDLGEGIGSILCIPLILNKEIIGVAGVANSYGTQGFARADQRLLGAIGSQIDTAIFEGLERRRLRRVLGRSLDPHVLERLLQSPDVAFLRGERAEISVLYADLRGSTDLAIRLAPELLVEFINDFLERMTTIILDHRATLDKYMGDEVMALFGAPVADADHAWHAVLVALEMQAAQQLVMADWERRGLPAAPIGIGVATGELIAGEMGCAQRTEYTVIGQAANLGARLCTVAPAGQVLICQKTYDQVRELVEAVPVTGLHLKGIGRHIRAYRLLALKG